MRDSILFAAAIGFAVGVALTIGCYMALEAWWTRHRRRGRMEYVAPGVYSHPDVTTPVAVRQEVRTIR